MHEAHAKATLRQRAMHELKELVLISLYLYITLGAVILIKTAVLHTEGVKFAPWGISGVVVIAESHLAIHIWPENRYAAIDVFTCGENVQMDVASAFLTREFQSKRPVQRRFTRGDHAVAGSSKCATVGPAESRPPGVGEQGPRRKHAASSSVA